MFNVFKKTKQEKTKQEKNSQEKTGQDQNNAEVALAPNQDQSVNVNKHEPSADKPKIHGEEGVCCGGCGGE